MDPTSQQPYPATGPQPRPEPRVPDWCGTVNLSHWQTDERHGLRVCVVPHECGRTSALDLLFNFGETLALTVEAPPTGTQRAEPGPHPRLDLHVNAGTGYGHDWCVVVDACATCSLDLWPALLAHPTGFLARHLSVDELTALDQLADQPDARDLLFPGDLEGNALMRPYNLVRTGAAVAAIQTAAMRARA